ncbi:HAD family hydrolase [Microbacterium sp. RU33B]|uniref:HAD family hydrolase n=1 Tax=Microbacterium sp. RU33B TaxID=1907390 RepID=UPI00095DCE7D|nr:HAD family hydrolase [Microbacterium sp. RU33B]SIT89805.1 Cof subfamily of IIB subfamily of haloacid dehalogenase superfamily/HAD-superfamily hydrolase, subfamily IIB [Microbacterium sp. RU33B]
MSSSHLPPTGSIKVVKPTKAAKLVEHIADDTENPDVATERLLIALDIDGTIILEDESMSPGVIEAIEHAHRAGHEVMLATGRSWEGTRGIMRVLEIAPEYVVCSNGAVILKRRGGDLAEELQYERFHVETFDPTDVLTVLRENLPQARYMVELADGRRLYTEEMHDWNLANARRVPFAELSAQPVCRVVAVSPDESQEEFGHIVAGMGLTQVSYAIGWSAWLDIAPEGVDKSTALDRVRGWLDIDPAHVLVIGDGRNDVGMFQWALRNGGRAVAMAQGPQEVRDAAGELTSSVSDGGVAAVLRGL